MTRNVSSDFQFLIIIKLKWRLMVQKALYQCELKAKSHHYFNYILCIWTMIKNHNFNVGGKGKKEQGRENQAAEKLCRGQWRLAANILCYVIEKCWKYKRGGHVCNLEKHLYKHLSFLNTDNFVSTPKHSGSERRCLKKRHSLQHHFLDFWDLYV